ncbi:hypothetical protein [Spectribacter hydrogenoxidans]|uniref:Uncharacterized protein n=1 Tax=Spectribacter hydrogenoxidans TaxID=3075608 RepID=A0ABU3C0M3_9GAMM|nr:hypothetical protein [Salinisphaera sp. W335]MDT0635099.1 hypothetical protein [Salinisphaera sp. W335]
MDPVALQVLEAIRDRLKAIDGSGDFTFNVGERVYLGRLFLNPNDIPGISVLEDDDPFEVEDNGTRYKETGTYRVQGVVAADDDNPLKAGHQLLADMKRALFLAPNGPEFEKLGDVPTSMTYTGRQVFQREDGQRHCEAHLFLTVAHFETWGDPTAT